MAEDIVKVLQNTEDLTPERCLHIIEESGIRCTHFKDHEQVSHHEFFPSHLALWDEVEKARNEINRLKEELSNQSVIKGNDKLAFLQRKSESECKEKLGKIEELKADLEKAAARGNTLAGKVTSLKADLDLCQRAFNQCAEDLSIPDGTTILTFPMAVRKRFIEERESLEAIRQDLNRQNVMLDVALRSAENVASVYEGKLLKCGDLLGIPEGISIEEIPRLLGEKLERLKEAAATRATPREAELSQAEVYLNQCLEILGVTGERGFSGVVQMLRERLGTEIIQPNLNAPNNLYMQLLDLLEIGPGETCIGAILRVITERGAILREKNEGDLVKEDMQVRIKLLHEELERINPLQEVLIERDRQVEEYKNKASEFETILRFLEGEPVRSEVLTKLAERFISILGKPTVLNAFFEGSLLDLPSIRGQGDPVEDPQGVPISLVERLESMVKSWEGSLCKSPPIVEGVPSKPLAVEGPEAVPTIKTFFRRVLSPAGLILGPERIRLKCGFLQEVYKIYKLWWSSTTEVEPYGIGEFSEVAKRDFNLVEKYLRLPSPWRQRSRSGEVRVSGDALARKRILYLDGELDYQEAARITLYLFKLFNKKELSELCLYPRDYKRFKKFLSGEDFDE